MKSRRRLSRERGVRWKCRFAALRVGVLVSLLILALPSAAELAAGSMDVKWNEGAEDCSKAPQPPLQVHRYNETTFILRENPCATYEAPFIYLLVGATRALLIDSGDVSDPQSMPLARTVLSLLPPANFPLLIVHTHGHLDHRMGDGQFAGAAGVEIIGTSLQDVTRGLHLTDWPNSTATLDLGGRTVDVIPTPGHHPTEVSYYDRATGLFFSGDFFLPGRLLIADTEGDLASARRVAQFLADRPVSYVLGGHIELDQAGGMFLGVHYHPNERALQLSKADLLGLPSLVSGFNGFYGKHGVYVLENQNRVLMAFAAALVVLLVAAGFVVRAMILRRRQRIARALSGKFREPPKC
jgi:hydroxyacylglutathione hydrolase